MSNDNPDGAWYHSTCHIDSSLWGKTAEPAPELEMLKEDSKADVVVVGAGFCGLSTALHLSERGYNVTVVDAHEPGWGASGRNGGQVIPGLKIMPDEMVRRFGSENGERIAATAGKAPELVYELIRKFNIDCDLQRSGWIQLAKGPRGSATINSHLEQWGARGANVKALSRSDISKIVGTDAYHCGHIDKRGGNLHPLNYARGLARACLSLGASIYRDSPALSVERMNGNWTVRTGNGNVNAEMVVLCTNAYSGNLWPDLSTSIVPVLTGVVATDPLPAHIRKTILPNHEAVADTRRLLSWFGIDSADRLVFGSRTNSQRESIDPENFQFGIRRLHEIFPETKGIELKHLWTGRVALTLDHVPHIHQLADGLYSGSGFQRPGSGHGDNVRQGSCSTVQWGSRRE